MRICDLCCLILASERNRLSCIHDRSDDDRQKFAIVVVTMKSFYSLSSCDRRRMLSFVLGQIEAYLHFGLGNGYPSEPSVVVVVVVVVVGVLVDVRFSMYIVLLRLFSFHSRSSINFAHRMIGDNFLHNRTVSDFQVES